MDNLDVIEGYFTKTLADDQVREFEKRIESDPAFAEEVAFYLSTMKVSQQTFHSEKKQQFKEIYQSYISETQQTDGKITPEPILKKTPSTPIIRKLTYWVAAAAVVAGIVFGINLFTGHSSPQVLADQYISANYETLGVTMSSRSDSIQTGLQMYNEGKFSEALTQFENILQSDTSVFDAKKYAGLAALRMKEYQKALSYFEQLEIYPGLYSNPALILQAVTLMERNQPGDAAKAKLLLKKVVDQDLDGKDLALEWLKKL